MTATEISKNIWTINESGYVDAYLLVGSKRALLIDALYNEDGLYNEIRKITQLPTDVVITHGHGDHAGMSMKALHENGCTIYMDLQDMPYLQGMMGDAVKIEWFTDIANNMCFDLGGFKLEVIPVPGHTPGSVVLLERDKQLLFTGDTIGSCNFWMQLPHSLNLSTFMHNLEKLWETVSQMEDLIIHPGHRNQAPDLGLQYVKDVKEITKQLVSGEAEGTDGEMELLGMKIKYKSVSHGLVKDYLYNPQNI